MAQSIQQPVILNPLAVRPWEDEVGLRLPGLQPLSERPWLLRDEAYSGQMALRDRLFDSERAACFAALPGSEAAQEEARESVTAALAADAGYAWPSGAVRRPDGTTVTLGRDPALLEAARLVQEDLLLLAPDDPQNTLIAAALAFPASWTLSQKIGRPLSAIHTPVKRIEADMQTRIDRVIQRLPAGETLWRANLLGYNDPSLHQPRSEGEHKPLKLDENLYVRVERQTLTKLPLTRAVLFTIHTSIWPETALPESERQAVRQVLERHAAGGQN